MASVLGVGVAACGTAGAGGISLYGVGTADVGLTSAGYSARAQDASTVFTNPAGMTRLSGDQLTLGVQLLHGDLGFSIGHGTTPALGTNAGGNPVEWLPGGGMFYAHSVSPDFKIGLAITGNFGSVVKYDDGRVGRYRRKRERCSVFRSSRRSRGASTRISRWGPASTRWSANSKTRWPSTTSSGPMAVSSWTTTRGASARTSGCSTK